MADSNRRAFLGSLAATVAVGATGCLSGGSGGDDTPTPTDSMDDGGMTEDDMMTETEDGMMGTEDGMDGEMTEDGMDNRMTETEDGMMETTTFEVTVTNVSEPGTITTSDGNDVAVPLAPVAYAVHSDDASLFTECEAASDGLESLAEDGHPGTLVEEVSGGMGVVSAGAAATPDGADSHAPLMPGDSYSFEVEAGHDHTLSLATMFVQSNDLFYAPDPSGLSLFEMDEALNGDVTDRLTLWDAGTEQNQEPGAGPDQAPRQMDDDTGPEEDAPVRAISQVMDEYDYPDTSEVIEVTVTSM